jgi:hypothetical protein
MEDSIVFSLHQCIVVGFFILFLNFNFLNNNLKPLMSQILFKSMPYILNIFSLITDHHMLIDSSFKLILKIRYRLPILDMALYISVLQKSLNSPRGFTWLSLKRHGTTIKSMWTFQGRDHIHLLRKVVCLFNLFGLLCHVEINHGAAPFHALGAIGKHIDE